MFMTKTELESMTGLVRAKAQARWLHANGIPVLFRADGTLLVLKADIEARLGGMVSKSAKPHWEALDMSRRPYVPAKKSSTKRPGIPAFRKKVDEEDQYHVYRYLATPRWLTYEQRMQMRALYKQAAGTRKSKATPLSVDHIIPLRGQGVCGLHVPWNLRVIPLRENQRKNNKYSVDHEDT